MKLSENFNDERKVKGKQVLITSGVLHPCPLLSSWYFSYMPFSINFLGNKLPLLNIFNSSEEALLVTQGNSQSGDRG